MSSKINVVIPMAGLGSRFSEAGYIVPKPFIRFQDRVNFVEKTMIEHVVDNLHIEGAEYFLILKKEHYIKEVEVVKNIQQVNKNVHFIPIDFHTEGQASTVLYLHKLINNETPLLIANCDQLLDIDINNFVSDVKNRSLDGSILTFEDNDPKWSFVRLNADGLVDLVKEKEVLSNYANVGIFFFNKGSDFVNFSIDMVVRNDRCKNEFYISLVYNYAINAGLKVGHYNIAKEQMHGIGTPADLDSYLSFDI